MTGAGPPDPSQARAGTDDVVHCGIRWQRASSGALRWWDDDAAGWVRYRAGDDAPPRPDGWDPSRANGRDRARAAARPGPTLSRPSWRSPYRIVPLVLLALVIVVAVVQATRGSGGQDAAEGKAASALLGRCLVPDRTSGGTPTYRSKGVACDTAGAAVRVVRVLPGTPGSPPCPQGTTSVQLAYAGVRYPHQLCVEGAPAGAAAG